MPIAAGVEADIEAEIEARIEARIEAGIKDRIEDRISDGTAWRGGLSIQGCRVKILDDLDLEKIIHSGQCFRGARIGEWYRFITKDKVLYIRPLEGKDYAVSCDEKEWRSFWRPYFDLRRKYSKVRTRCKADPFMKEAAKRGKGIRVLKQDAWEMVISFIISQRKSIPAIKNCVEALCQRYGKAIETEHETLYTFPTWEALGQATAEELKSCGLGYRVPYIMDAARVMGEEKIDLADFEGLDDEALFERLKSFKGVGDKVASCIMLYAYGRTAAVPIDTWINKIIEEYYGGENPFTAYGEDAGIVQQYAFDYVTNKE